MKIAMIGHKRIPSREGGIEIVVEELAERMVAKGHEVYCYNRKGHHVSGDKDNDLEEVKLYKGIHIITIPTFEKKSLNAARNLKLGERGEKRLRKWQNIS